MNLVKVMTTIIIRFTLRPGSHKRPRMFTPQLRTVSQSSRQEISDGTSLSSF